MALPESLRTALADEAQPAIVIDRAYQVVATNTAYDRRYGHSPRRGGLRCHEVSHGYATPCDENGEQCPLRASLGSGRIERVVHVHHSPRGPEHCDIELRPHRDSNGEIDLFMEVITPVDIASARTAGAEMIGRSSAFNEVVGLIRRVAPSQVPVLLLGESGTGKELAARAVHESSARAAGPFVPVECSGLSEGLFESELFGYERGAFTGAHQRRDGLVEAARGGTLFLDEIGDVPLPLQVKLLRLLESMTYRRVGGVEALPADFRLVCATHRNLDDLVDRGAFRRDLSYRINAFPIRLPPLRARRSDVTLLADAFLQRMTPRRRLAPDARRHLEAYDFPGNIRELRNLLQRAVLLADDSEILARHLPPHVTGASAPRPLARPEQVVPLDEAERIYLAWAVAHFDGPRQALAQALGVSERTLYRKLEQLD